MHSALLSVPGLKNEFSYINSSENVISLHVKITCYFHM